MSNQDLYIYHVSQSEVDGYDTFSDMVVIAVSAEEARKIHPYDKDYKNSLNWGTSNYVWASSPDHCTAVLIGTALGNGLDEPIPGIICTSFHAG